MLALVKEVKKFRKYEQFFLHEKNKKYRNCALKCASKRPQPPLRLLNLKKTDSSFANPRAPLTI